MSKQIRIEIAVEVDLTVEDDLTIDYIIERFGVSDSYYDGDIWCDNVSVQSYKVVEDGI